MVDVSDAAHRTDRELSAEVRARLEAAHQALRVAVAAYESFVGGRPEAGKSAPVHDLDEMRRAQAEVESAEDRLWQLREALLGWTRPSWSPSASLTSDWFSDEDAVYDDLPETTAP